MDTLYRVAEPFGSSTLYFKIPLVLLLSSFMIFTARSFLRFRIKKKEAEYRSLVRVLGITDDEAEFSTRAISQEYAQGDYGLPVAFATAVSLFGFSTLFFGADLVSLSMDAGRPNMILTGMFADPQEMQRLRWQSQLVLATGFAGAFVWSAQNIIRRLITGHLTPSAYYSAGLRMVFASLLSLMLSFFLEVFPDPGFKRQLLPVIAFLAGMMPENALVYLKERIHLFSARNEDRSHALPLQMIEGINMFHKVRLGEVGIDNAQNLAEANVVELLLKTPFNPNQLIDWIAQAKLYLYFKADIEKLRKLGIRTVFDVRALCGSGEKIAQVSEEAQVSGTSLALLCERLREDHGVARLERFHQQLDAIELADEEAGAERSPRLPQRVSREVK